jgi:hypothetical protein
MRTLLQQSLNEISLEAIHVLCRQLGVVNTLRYLNQFTTGFGNYTEEREELFKELTLEEIVTDIKSARESD